MPTHHSSESGQAKSAIHKRHDPADRSRETRTDHQSFDLQQAFEHVSADPTVASSNDVIALQRAVGNRAVTQLLDPPLQAQAAPVSPREAVVQAALVVGPSTDRYEQEADRVADKVADGPGMTSSTGPSVQRQLEEEEEVQAKPLVQRQLEEEEEVQAKPLVQRQLEEEEEIQAKPLVQRQPEEEEEVQAKPVVQRQLEEEEEVQAKPLVQRQPEEEEEVQAKPVAQRADGGFVAGDEVARRLTSTRGGGNPLPSRFRADVEAQFGTDFSRVRVHTDGEANWLNKNLMARAFTHGTDIYFSAGQYDPSSREGRRLLAHELTHVVQQTGGSGQSSHKGRSTSGRSLHQDSGSSGAAASIRPAVQRIDAVQRAAKPWEEVGLTEDEWRKRVQEKKNAMAGMLGATVLQPGTTGTINSTSPQNVTSPSPPDTTSDTDQTQSDEDYIRQQQEKYRPPKEELEKLLKGAERIIAQQRAPQTPKATGSGVLSKVKGFFSGITGRLSKRKKVDPIPEPPPLPTQSSPPGLQRPKAPVDTRSLAEQLQSERLSRGMTAMEMPTAIGQGTQPSSRWEKFKTKASSFFSGFKTKAGGALSWAKSKVAGGAKGFRRGVYFNKPTSTDSVARGQDSSVTPSMPPPSTQVPTLPGRGSGYVAPNQRDLRPQDGTSGSPPQTSSDEGATDRGKDMEVRILTLERDLKDLQLQINQLAQKAKV